MENYLSTVKKYFEDNKSSKRKEDIDEAHGESEIQSDIFGESESQPVIPSNDIEAGPDSEKELKSSSFKKVKKDPYYFKEKGDYDADISYQKSIQSLPLRELSFFPKKFIHDKRFHSSGVNMLLKMFYSSSRTRGACLTNNCVENMYTQIPDHENTENFLNDEDFSDSNAKHRHKNVFPEHKLGKDVLKQSKSKSIFFHQKNHMEEPLKHINFDHQSQFNSYGQDSSEDDTRYESRYNDFNNDGIEEGIPKIENSDSSFDRERSSTAAFDSKEKNFFPCSFPSRKNKVTICYHTKNGIKRLNTVQLDDHAALENFAKFNKNSENKMLNKVHDLMKYDEEHFVSEIGTIFPSSKKLKERDKLLKKLKWDKYKEDELLKMRVTSAEERAIDNLAKKIGHGDRRQGAAVLSQMIDTAENIGQPVSDIRKGNVIEIRSDHDADDGILKVVVPDSSESTSYILNKIRNNNATKRNFGKCYCRVTF